MASGGGNKLVTVDSEELRFQIELEKPSHCDLKVSNATDKNIAFKVKTTSPKKYFVRPNTGIIPPWDTCIIRVTLQAQLQYSPDMQCRDKFLLQCTPVPPNSDSEELPPNTHQAVQAARAARDAAVRETTQLQQELDMLKIKNHKKSPGFSIRLVITAGVIGIMVGLLLKLVLSSPPPPPISSPSPSPTAGITE